MKMKKILIYGLSNMYGGVEAFILNYVNHLPENKYTVELIIMNRTPQYLGEKLKREVKIHYVPERIKNPLGYNCRVKQQKNMEFRLGLHTAIILKTWGTN